MITTLKEIIDPKSRYVFLDDEEFIQALEIKHLEDKKIFFGFQEFLPHKKRAGYFIAANGAGIVRFRAECLSLAGDSSALFPQCLVPDMNTLNLINRREFNRYTFPTPFPIAFTYEGRVIQGWLINISKGGSRMKLHEHLPSQVLFSFEVNLPTNEGSFVFKSDGLIVYCEPEENPGYFMAGVTFVAPDFENEEERERYILSRDQLAQAIAHLAQ